MNMRTNNPKLLTLEISNRQIDWICQKNETAKQLFTLKQKREYLETLISQSADDAKIIKELQLKSDLQLLPDEDLEWINKNDTRLLRWLADWCSKSFAELWTISTDHEKKLYESIIRTIDFWEESIPTKRFCIANIKSKWAKILLKDAKLKWLKIENTEQIEWAWIYLNNYLHKNNIFTSNYNPTCSKDYYTAIISTFDNWSTDRDILHELQTNMKQAWAQQKYRENLKSNDKKQSTYALSNTAKINLKKLAEENNVNLNQMLEYIINDAYKKLKKGTPK